MSRLLLRGPLVRAVRGHAARLRTQSRRCALSTGPSRSRSSRGVLALGGIGIGFASLTALASCETDPLTFQPSIYGMLRPMCDMTRAKAGTSDADEAQKGSAGEGDDRRVLLISDVDYTMTGSNAALRAFNDYWVREQVPRGSCLVYNTARPSGLNGHDETGSSFLALVRTGKYDLMKPDVLITCEGTEIFWMDGDTPRRDMEYHSHLGEFWDEDLVKSNMEPLDEHLIRVDGGDFNADDTFRVAISVADEVRAKDIAERCQAQFGPHYNVFYMESWIRGIYLVSCLPSSASKGHAAEYVASQLSFRQDRTLWAADSDNDLPMLGTHALRGVVVGNSFSKRLRAHAVEDKDAHIYQAHSEFAAGVMEGIAFMLEHDAE